VLAQSIVREGLKDVAAGASNRDRREQAGEQVRSRRPRAWRAARAALDKKAIDLTMLDVQHVSSVTDYFLVCTGNTGRQAKSIQDGIHEGLKREHGLPPRRVEGSAEGGWILMDYLDVVVHVFTPEVREYYRLEQLWGEAPARAISAVTAAH